MESFVKSDLAYIFHGSSPYLIFSDELLQISCSESFFDIYDFDVVEINRAGDKYSEAKLNSGQH